MAEISFKTPYRALPMPPSKKPATTIVFTTAPADYDWWFTIERGVAGTTHGKTVRKVEIESDRVEQQCDRYASGCHMAVDETEWMKLVGYGLATPSRSSSSP